jgi:uncharacterized protein (TIGR03083 family)
MAIDYVAHVRTEATALAAVARTVPLDRRIPACRAWDVAALLGHIGRIHRWATVAASTGKSPDMKKIEPRPTDAGLALDYFDRGWPPLVEALAALDPQAPGWNFAPVPQLRGFWRRRQAQETLVHRIDVEMAAGVVGPVDAALAADGVDEALEVMAPRKLDGRDGVDLGGSIHLHCTDTEGEWTFRTDDGVFRLSRGHSKGDCAVRGPARSLLLLLWGRLDDDDSSLEILGDATLLDRWFALDPTP